jgi:glycosyltransferase involved in cell wall biosynthesis
MITLLYSGNIGIGQDLATVLQAAARFNGDTDLHILIVGGGKGLARTRQIAANLRLRNVEFREPVPLYRLAELLVTGDIHIICQKPGTEGLLVPSKIYSTIAVGRPSLFVGPTDCEVGRIVRDSRSGFVVEPGDVEGVSDALTNLLFSSALREEMGENARAYYRLRFGRQRSVSRIVEILERVAGNEQLDNQSIPLIDRGLANEE